MHQTSATVSRDKFISLNALQFYRDTKQNLFQKENLIGDDLLNTDRIKMGKINLIEKLFGPCQESKQLVHSFRDMIKVLPTEFDL